MKLGKAEQLTELLYMYLEVGDEFEQNVMLQTIISLDVPKFFWIKGNIIYN